VNAPERLTRHARPLATGGDLFARTTARGFRRVLDRIDQGLKAGALHALLPDGTRRTLGGRALGPECHVHLRHWRALVRLGTTGSVGWYEAWARGEWDSPDPVPLFALFMKNGVSLGNVARAKGLWRVLNAASHALRANAPGRARRNIEAHYDLGNAFYAAWLDESMTYSSAVFEAEEPLEEAQRRKNRLLLDRLDLKPGQRLLEIGCGWGGLMELAARERGVQVTGLTLSSEQRSWAEQRLAGLSADVLLEDYRQHRGSYDAVVSVEMAEAVGREYWPAYLGAIARALKPGGRAALQFISIDHRLFPAYARSADFIQAYVFPGGMLIDEPEFRGTAQAAGLRWQDRAGYGLHYAETLRQWRTRFDAAVAASRLPPGFDERFVRLWRYYLMYCEGGFRGQGIDVAQVTLFKS